MSSEPEIRDVIMEWLPTVVCVEDAVHDTGSDVIRVTLDNGKKLIITVKEEGA